jgi:membrane associated rhomboid family serine protease
MGFNLTPVVKNLLLINIIMFALSELAPFGLDLRDMFGLRYIFAPKFEIFQFVTHMFIHADFGHLFSNMLGLFVFGPMLEQFWGPKRFLIFYMVTGLGAGALFLGINFFETYNMGQATLALMENTTPESLAQYSRNYIPISPAFINQFANDPNNIELIRDVRRGVERLYVQVMNAPMYGASGAVYGVLMAFGLLFPNLRLMLLFPPIPVKAKYLVAVYGIMALFGAIHNTPGDNVAHYAHLGGMLFAWIMVLLWRGDRNNIY